MNGIGTAAVALPGLDDGRQLEGRPRRLSWHTAALSDASVGMTPLGPPSPARKGGTGGDGGEADGGGESRRRRSDPAADPRTARRSVSLSSVEIDEWGLPSP